MANRSRISRRHFCSGAAAAVAAASAPSLAQGQSRQMSVVAGVQLGTITYSYRSMPDQGAEAVLGYIVDSGINAVEFMDTHAETFAGAPPNPHPDYRSMYFSNRRGDLDAAGIARLETMTPAYDAWLGELAAWRRTAEADDFSRLRSLYDDAGVRIYAYKPDVFSADRSDEELQYAFTAARALGATHVTTELPEDPAMTRRFSEFAGKNRLPVAYHTHLQASMTAFDSAFAQSPFNLSNVDLGHYVAAPQGGNPLPFLRKYHDRIASVHLKDRKTADNGGANMPFGEGDTPIADILALMRDAGYDFPVTIELEYPIPEGSNAITEMRKCVDYCKAALLR